MSDSTNSNRMWTHWEFWPAWIFYLPVVLKYARLAIKYRSFGIPAHANPGIETGGLIGESKMDVLCHLQKSFPEYTAQSWLLNQPDQSQRKKKIHRLLENQHIQLPFILKPDTGQRGSGVKLIRRTEQIDSYINQCSAPVVVQQYVNGPLEAGVFYYRFPSETHGHIFAITDKHFPVLIGDGHSTLKQLILSDPRASHMRRVYFKRFQDILYHVPNNETTFPLVQSGNHAQGCLFKDGMHLYTESLREQFDIISKSLPSFFVGRYDIRYANKDDLMQGKGFKIVELNGAASEATNIYDPSNTLKEAYQILFRQWELVFSIGKECCSRYGLEPYSGWSLLKRWKTYQKTSQSHPIAD
ncbi:MAG: carboxylate--amine ligase [Verrucomicrobia bacterium]|jgi:hypothetical protein|nr:carboxylate--amine ligase [Verrucomicrobiota bacterium]